MDISSLLGLHVLLSDKLLPDSAAGGRLRTRAMGVGQSSYTRPTVPQLIEESFMQLIDKAAAIGNANEQAFLLIVQLPYLQPFENVQVRIAPGGQCPAAAVAAAVVVSAVLCRCAAGRLRQRLAGRVRNGSVDLLRDVLLWACERSAVRCAKMRQSLGEPDSFRLRYPSAIGEMAAQVVRNRIGHAATPAHFRSCSSTIPTADQARFQQAVEAELLSLQDCNIARYRLRPSDFMIWHAIFYNAL